MILELIVYSSIVSLLFTLGGVATEGLLAGRLATTCSLDDIDGAIRSISRGDSTDVDAGIHRHSGQAYRCAGLGGRYARVRGETTVRAANGVAQRTAT